MKTVLRDWTSGEESGRNLYFWCLGCNDIHGVEVGQPNGWAWNHDEEKPTISPSLMTKYPVGGRVCHLFVRDGNVEWLNDSHHHLAGQTLPLPDVDEEGWRGGA